MNMSRLLPFPWGTSEKREGEDFTFSNLVTLLALFTLVVSLFPWVAAFRGEILGVRISMRSLANIIGGCFILLGVAYFFWPPLQEVGKKWAALLDGLNYRQKLQFVWACAAFYAVGVISHLLKAHFCLGTHAMDLGMFSNVCWNTSVSQDLWLYSSLMERPYMAVHTHWILWPLSFLYKIWGDAPVLLACHALFVALAIPFLILTVQKITGSLAVGTMAGILFVSSVYIGKTVGVPFTPDLWQVPCLMAALWAWHRGSKGGVIVFASLALLAKEDAPIIMGALGTLFLCVRHWRLVGGFLILIATSVFLFETQVYMPSFIDEGNLSSLSFGRYPILGANYEEMVKNLFFSPGVYWKALWYDPMKYLRFLKMFFPVVFLTFFSPLFVLPIGLGVLPHILSQASSQLSLDTLYALSSQAFLFVGAAHGFNRLIQRGFLTGREKVLVGICLIVAGIGVIDTPRFYRYEKKERLQAFAEVKSHVPAQASLATQQNLYPHFASRRYIQLFPLGNGFPPYQTRFLENPDFIVADRLGNSLPYNGDQLKRAIENLENNARYEKVFEKKGFLVFKRKNVEERTWVSVRHMKSHGDIKLLASKP